jgi:hypothetical protein
MASRKPPKRLFKNKEVIHTYQHERENKLNMKSMSRDHLDVLQNIEFTLVRAARQVTDIDDRTVDAALGLALSGEDPNESNDLLAVDLCKVLREMRESRLDVSDNLWRAGLKTVRDSVRRHSSLAKGEMRYIKFVEPYLR